MRNGGKNEEESNGFGDMRALMVLCMLTLAALAAETVGDFVVEGGISGTDFTFSGGVLTFTQPGTYTVSMKTGATTPTTNRIAVTAAGTVSTTLSGMKISLTSAYSACGEHFWHNKKPLVRCQLPGLIRGPHKA